ncbi:hypothetical protein VTN02DRAFT_3371 [Thermoascus thermophilus]
MPETNGKSLVECIAEAPSVPKEAKGKIARLEYEFARAEYEQLRKSVPVFRPLYEKRNALITSTPELQGDFWTRVFANAPAEIDEYVLPSDAAILGQSLKNLTVDRFEVDDKGEGEPRSLRFTFEFATGDENPYFEDAKIVKDFYWRKEVTKTAKGKRRTWEGLVSEPVRIRWKKDMDPTKGLLDAACDLAEAEKKQGAGGDRKKLPEYERLVKKVEEVEAEALNADNKDDADDENDDDENPSPAGVSFFAWFGYRGKNISAEKAKEAAKEEQERWEKIAKGEEVELSEDEEDDDDEEDEEDELEVAEIFPDGEDLANAIAEELWPNALRFYGQSFEAPDDYDDLGLGELDDEDEDDEDGEDEDAKDEEEEERPRKKVKT